MSEMILLGQTDLNVSRICFGCWQMARNQFWPTVDEQAMHDAVGRALDLGVNFFDTADAYGDGFAEELLGRILKGVPRDRFVLADKVYHHWLGPPGSPRVGDLSYEYIVWECEQSLRRLGLDHMDLYQAHTFDVMTHPEETSRAFDKLKKDGKIRYYGVSNFTAEQLRCFRGYGDYDSVQPRYNLLDRAAEQDLFPYCMAQKIGVLTYSSLMLGLLTGKFTGSETFDDARGMSPFFRDEEFKRNVDKVNRLRPIAERLGKSVTQVALRAILEHPAVSCA
ncbi:MAG TPA: aldo/keto reductase, partial [Phycisphaerae bacterium]|nr:aldo/keto reductase [Phycisphaerae bacterium]